MTTREAIQRTLYLYGWYYDEDDLDGLIGCFEPDATLSFTSDVARTAKGHAAIREFYEMARGRRSTAREQTRHTICNILVENETADTADVLSYWVLPATKDGGGTTVMSGFYRDKMVRSGTVWRFKERTIHADMKYEQRAFEAWRPSFKQ